MLTLKHTYKNLLILPIFVTILLSCVHLYPFIDRLIAFLIPLFIIVMNEYKNHIFSIVLSINFIFISLNSLSISISDIHKLLNYRNNPVQYLHNDKINKELKFDKF